MSATVLVVGNPNSGKTTLFNLLTGARAKVGNYPGVTVDRRTAPLTIEDHTLELVDLPGSYSLTARSAEERVAVDALLARGDDRPRALVVVADATTLRRGLYFVSQVLEAGIPAVLALTMMDEARRAGITIDARALAAAIGCEVVPMVASKGEGKDALLAALAKAVRNQSVETCSPPLPESTRDDVREVEAAWSRASEDALDERARRLRAHWALLSIGGDELLGIPAEVRATVEARRRAATEAGRDLDEELVAARYAWVDAMIARALVAPAAPSRRRSARIDDVLLHPIGGLALFALVMAVVFQALFSWSEPAIGAIEAGIELAKGAAVSALPAGPLRDLLVSGVIAGVGNVVVFVPQIALLFAFVTLLEDSGYLARVAFVIDRLMGGVGLHGRAFVPMLSGFACAIPAVMATRTIESRRDRLLTMLVIPLTSCSARLPVYVLVTSAVFDAESRVFGLVSTGAVVLFAMYATSIVAAIGVAFVLRRTVLRGPRPALVLELPPYRAPQLRNVVGATVDRVKRFLVDAGTMILALTIVLWAALTYPRDATLAARFDAEREAAAAIVEPEARVAREEAIAAEQASAELRSSIGGRIGTAMEPALRPLGLDWRIGVGILGAFAAREVFVSTLGIVYGLGDAATEESQPLREALRAAKHADGSPVFTPLSGITLLVFFVLACQCMSTIAVVRRESGSWRWAALMFGYMSTLAYVGALLVHQIGRALGWGIA